MNRKMIVYTVGRMVLLEAGILLLPLLVSILYRETCAWAFVLTVLLAAIVGLPITLFCKPKNSLIYAKEGFVIVAMTWLAFSAIGALPFVFSGEIPSFADAFFETVSGLTTTGASILRDVESMSHGLLFWRSFTHWIGGMGVLVFIMAIVPDVSGRPMHILRAEMPGPVVGKLVPRIKDTAKILYLIYIAMTVLEIVLLLCGGMSELIAKNGGIAWIIQKLRKVMKGNKSAQVGIAAMVSLCDCATANNTVAIIVAGDMARDVSQEYRVDPRRTASLLDIFSCVFQGIIPYGAQLLSAAALTNATVTTDALRTSPAAIVGGMWYCWILAAVGLLSIFIPFADGVCRKDPWNWEYGCAQSGVEEKKALLEKEAE